METKKEIKRKAPKIIVKTVKDKNNVKMAKLSLADYEKLDY